MNVRIDAIVALGEIADVQAIEALMRAMKDPNPTIITETQKALAKIFKQST